RRLALSRAIVSVIAPIKEGHAHDCANQTSADAPRESRSSAGTSVSRRREGDEGSRPTSVLGRPADREILALLLGAVVRDGVAWSPPSARSLLDGPVSCPVIFFLSDGRAVKAGRLTGIIGA